MVRDRAASHDGWFWGWFGWSGWAPDWPPGPRNTYPNMGFGQYCLNCHASARDNLTFSSLRNVAGEPGEPLVFLSHGFFEGPPLESHHRLVSLPTDDAPRLGQPRHAYDPAFTSAIPADNLPRPTWGSVSRMPSETYDTAWASAGEPTAADEFLTSDQCIGCHDAGSTGLQFDMTEPNSRNGELLNNLSPYATWKTSPMGLGGRDPIFYAQLASETETFHPGSSELIQDTCLGCHGVLGQRQHAIDSFEKDGECAPFLRKYADAVPWPAGNPTEANARYGALARDGISCTACHRMLVGVGDEDPGRPENRCVEERQQSLNPHNTGFGRTFTGSFLVGSPTELYGPFEEPKTRPMENALGIEPRYTEAVRSSEMCGSCHTVHLPVMHRDRIIGSTYEQTTYPEWAFSDYRTGEAPQGPLPTGRGSRAESCQSCHMPSRNANGDPYRSKIASIQEYSNFPQAEYNLGPRELDLDVRAGFARHTLVGLNVFFIKMAQQFPDILGIRTQDPMLVGKGVDPLLRTEQAMLDQASKGTARLSIDGVELRGDRLAATVKVTSDTGHKFPSGVGFRRAFLELSVFDETGDVLWASGRTNDAGIIVDEAGRPIAGELWWNDDCSERLDTGDLAHQPHYQVVRAQDEAQIYQELVTAPAPVENPVCGDDPTPGGAFTTSFLSICGHVKDNRILPHGFLPLEDRVEIAEALGAHRDLAEDAGPHAVADDPDYQKGGRRRPIRGRSLRVERFADGSPGQVVLPGHPAVLPPGPFLHLAGRGRPAALLHGRPPQPGGHRRPGLEARGREHGAGARAVSRWMGVDLRGSARWVRGPVRAPSGLDDENVAGLGVPAQPQVLAGDLHRGADLRNGQSRFGIDSR